MGARRRLVATTLLAVGLLACTSCKRKDRPPEEKPPDHLAPNEVAEGKERAFGIPLPVVARVLARFEKTVHIVSPLTPEELVNFVRVRVKDGKTTAGTAGTHLAEVVPLGSPQMRVSIEIRSKRTEDGMRSEMIVEDTTPIASEPGLTDEQRWKKAGLTPDGKVADPKHLQ
jgi:hypothetical protein